MPTTRTDLRQNIRTALSTITEGDFHEQCESLLNTLGYHSDRTLPGQTGGPNELIGELPDTKDKQEFLNEAQTAHLLFQVTDSELGGAQLFREDKIKKSQLQSYLFIAVTLRGEDYSRTRLSSMTRLLNKQFRMPAVVLFKTANSLLTLAFVHRRENKRHPKRDVLGSVALVRQIKLIDTHRAHLDILSELALAARLRWMDANGEPTNFDGLLAAWLDALDTEELNRRFYRELFDWFERTVSEATFPNNQHRTVQSEEHIIRLITRLLFIWFIKEKGLVAEELFVEEQIRRLLKDYDRNAGDSYYRAVLQNLFFATLNTEIGKRGFSEVSNTTHRNFSCYRYKQEMSDSDGLLALFDRTPFINGGLFDCLDSEAATSDGGWRIDCFSDNPSHYKLLSIPNHLFFGDKGLISLFNRYKFTVEENTPVEREVALDPELLGKVFENLLAAYNPETSTTARKKTGSYYTPRPVVDYMVDEALVETLASKTEPADGDGKFWRERLHYLLDYNDAGELFDADETKELVRSISAIKILDPAVGSGAFPMGVLHKLTLALRRLDPESDQWEKLQKELAGQHATKAFDTPDQQLRDAELREISDTFKRYRDSDFGRKLYLIQNSIFGVDIQPVACQIAKLRFFISLAIEQAPNKKRNDNYGIRPLPNLETRFVAADTLLGLEDAEQLDLFREPIEKSKKKLAANRERHFHATTRNEKLTCRNEDRRLREMLAGDLKSAGLPEDDAGKIARWDPYDQNDKADWFDAEYMFGVGGGFDVVIGNPPYIQLQKDSGNLADKYQGAGYETFVRSGDIYQLFYEKGCGLLSRNGLLCYITSNSWLKAKYGEKTRLFLSQQYTPLRLLEMGKDIFENAIVDANVLILRQGRSSEAALAVDIDRLPDKAFPPNLDLWMPMNLQASKPWMVMSSIEQSIMEKMERIGTPLKDWDISIYRGVLTGLNDAFIVDNETKDALIAEDPASSELLKPILRGRDIRRYRADWRELWIIDTHNGYSDVPPINVDNYPAIKARLDKFLQQLKKRKDKGCTPYNLRSCAYYEDFMRDKIVWIELVNDGRFAFDQNSTYCEATSFLMTGDHLKYLCAFLNSNLIKWFLQQVAPTSGMGTLRWKKVYVETMSIPKIEINQQQPFIRLIDQIIKRKDADPNANTSKQEAEINQLTYDSYLLTNAEICFIESLY